MWHLRTRVGTFWIVESKLSDPENQSYFFGVDDCELGTFSDVNEAAQNVVEQTTGFFKWDCQSRVHAPSKIEQWTQGPPEGW